MSGLAIAAAVWAFIMLAVVWPICVMAKRADIAEAQRRHPSTWQSPAASSGTHSGIDWQPATEEAIAQAVAIVDDGKRLVAEAEDYLKRRVSDA